jgi:hypothetical protein
MTIGRICHTWRFKQSLPELVNQHLNLLLFSPHDSLASLASVGVSFQLLNDLI